MAWLAPLPRKKRSSFIHQTMVLLRDGHMGPNVMRPRSCESNARNGMGLGGMVSAARSERG